VLSLLERSILHNVNIADNQQVSQYVSDNVLRRYVDSFFKKEVDLLVLISDTGYFPVLERQRIDFYVPLSRLVAK